MFCVSLSMLLCCLSSSAPGFSSLVLSSSASGFSSQVLFLFASALKDFHITFCFFYSMFCLFYSVLCCFYPPLCFFPKSLCLSSCHNALPQSWSQSIECIGWYDAFILLLYIGYQPSLRVMLPVVTRVGPVNHLGHPELDCQGGNHPFGGNILFLSLCPYSFWALLGAMY